ncbi:MAG: DUF1080 domain-containing protein [Chitinophagaceae bacterium]|nr:DUF1080 domain-containing protein [Chitinophagaceae bacterium]
MKHLLWASSVVCIFFMACTGSEKQDVSEEWVQLFNKKDLTGWDIKIAKHALNENFNNTFYVKDSILKVDYSRYAKFDGEFGHLYYKEPFSYYKIRVTYCFTGQQLEGGPGYAYLNSGVMLHSQGAATLGRDQSFPVSLEMQFLASDTARKRTTGNLCTPGTFVSMNKKPVFDHCINSSSQNYSADQWITAEAVVYGDSVIHHIIEGDTVLTYTQPQIGGGFITIAQAWANFGFGADSLNWIQKQNTPLKSGYIALQAESHPLEFSKVELLNLEGCMDKNALNYKPYFVRADNSKCRY